MQKKCKPRLLCFWENAIAINNTRTLGQLSLHTFEPIVEHISEMRKKNPPGLFFLTDSFIHVGGENKTKKCDACNCVWVVAEKEKKKRKSCTHESHPQPVSQSVSSCFGPAVPVNQRRNTNGPGEKCAVDTKCRPKCNTALKHPDPSFITARAAKRAAPCRKRSIRNWVYSSHN